MIEPTPPVSSSSRVPACGQHAKQLEADGYMRLSIDEEVWRRFGRYGIDFEPDRYSEHSATAEEALERQLLCLVAEGRDVVVDFSFWQRADRQRYRGLVRAAGGRCDLIYLKVDAKTVRQRLSAPARDLTQTRPFPITDEILDRYIAAFEEPHDEGETIITSTD